MNDPKRTLAAITKLLAAFPSTNNNDPATVLRLYVEAVEDFDNRDIDGGVTLVVKGKLPGHDGRFCPTAPQFATATRIAMNARLDDEARYRLAHPRLAPPDVVKDEGTRDRVKALAATALNSLTNEIGIEAAEKRKHRTAMQEKLDRRFEPDMSARETARRLGLTYRGYEAGDPDGDSA